MLKIDAHQHFWNYHEATHQWINDEMSVLKRDFLPPELEQLLTSANVNGSVAVQAHQSEDETLFLLDLAENFNFIKGVVGWVDFQSPELEERLNYFSQYSKLKGFRHVVQDEPDDSFLLRDALMKGVSLLSKHQFTYDILIYPRQLQATILFVKQFPDQKFVVDHIAKPNIKKGESKSWSKLIAELAGCPNVWCKVSGMVTEADWEHWTYQDMQPYLEHVFDSFGPERVMFGSDWPVCLLAGEYKQVKALFESSISRFSDSQQTQMWGSNAVDFYGLK